MKEYSTYLFDLDGTLLDTMELIYRTFRATLDHFKGPDLTRYEILSRVGVPLEVQLEAYLGPLGENREEILSYHRKYQFSIYEEYLTLFPGVESTLGELRARGKTLAVVTSRTWESLEKYLSHFKLMNHFSLFVTPERTARPKPYPDPVLYALDNLGSAGDETIFIGDASVDILSGRDAGTDTGFALWGPNRPEDLPVEPTWILHSLGDLLK